MTMEKEQQVKALVFEHTIRTFLGAEADNIAAQFNAIKDRKAWYRKALKKIIRRVHDLETNTRHKEELTSISERMLNLLNGKEFDEAEFSVCLLQLVGALLGFYFYHGAIIRTPTYHQSPDEHYTEALLKGGDAMQPFYDKNNSIGIRKKIIKQLRNEGMADFQISLVLNTTEYQVIRLKKEL
jgi:hypothetical protein